MFKFKRVLYIEFDRPTGADKATYYDIVSAVLCGDEGYDRTPNGSNMYEVDLDPFESEDSPVHGLTVHVGNNGDWVSIQQNLNPHAEHETEPYHVELEMTEAIIEKDLLIVTGIKENAGGDV